MHPISQLFVPAADVSICNLREMLNQLQLSDPHCNVGKVELSATRRGHSPASSDRAGSVDSDGSSLASGRASGSTNSDALFYDAALLTTTSSAAPQPSKRSSRRKRNQENKRRMAEASMVVAMKEENSRYKTVLCPAWQHTGTCIAGEGCHYAHGQKELRSETDNQSAVNCLAKLMGKFSKAQRQSIAKQATQTKATTLKVDISDDSNSSHSLRNSPQRSPTVLPTAMVPPPLSPISNERWGLGSSPLCMRPSALPLGPITTTAPPLAIDPTGLLVTVKAPVPCLQPPQSHAIPMVAKETAMMCPSWGSPALSNASTTAPQGPTTTTTSSPVLRNPSVWPPAFAGMGTIGNMF